MEDVGGSTRTWSLYTAALRDRRVRLVDEFGGTSGLGDYPVVSGDGSTLVYGWAYLDYPNEECGYEEPEPGECPYQVLGGGARRVVGRQKFRIPGVPPMAAFAASAGRIAVVPADRRPSEKFSSPRPVTDGPVQIRRVDDGTIVSTFAPAGSVRAVALSGRNAAVLVADAAGEKRIERYDAVTGALRGATAVPRASAAALDVAGENVVFRVGRSIWLLRSRAGTLVRLWTARRTPVAVSIEGRRVVWAVNAKGRGRVLTLVLPRSS